MGADREVFGQCRKCGGNLLVDHVCLAKCNHCLHVSRCRPTEHDETCCWCGTVVRTAHFPRREGHGPLA